jgi:hypothetical protein
LVQDEAVVKSPHHVSKDLFGESQPAAARKPVSKSLFKEPSAPPEARAQVPHTQPNLFFSAKEQCGGSGSRPSGSVINWPPEFGSVNSELWIRIVPDPNLHYGIYENSKKFTKIV